MSDGWKIGAREQNLPSMSGGGFVQADQYQGPNLLVATSKSNILESKEGILLVCLFNMGQVLSQG